MDNLVLLIYIKKTKMRLEIWQPDVFFVLGKLTPVYIDTLQKCYDCLVSHVNRRTQFTVCLCFVFVLFVLIYSGSSGKT